MIPEGTNEPRRPNPTETGTRSTSNLDATNGSHTKPKPGTANSTNPTSADAAERAAQAAAAGTPSAAVAEVTKPPYANKPLHPKSETTFPYGHDAFGLRRGCIMRMAERAIEADKLIPFNKRYVFNFLYNPETVSYSTNVFQGIMPPAYRNPADTLTARFVGQETVSFGLMLDRTQEAYEEGLKTRGTLPDLEALYKVVNGNPGLQTGFLFLSAVRIYWGPWTQNGRPLPPFDGYITSINVEHTKFTPRMCPIRSLVSISASRLASTEGISGANNAYGKASTTEQAAAQ